MNRASILLSLLSCTGCAQLASDAPPDVDEYSMAARSWIGAEIEQMLAAWPNPNMHCGSNTIGEAGCAWWRHLRVGQYDYHCEAVAQYDEAGVITRIDVKKSRYCHRRFNDQFGRMTRRISRDGIEVEELGQ